MPMTMVASSASVRALTTSTDRHLAPDPRALSQLDLRPRLEHPHLLATRSWSDSGSWLLPRWSSDRAQRDARSSSHRRRPDLLGD
jgi:hypothetical protein